MLQKIRTLLSGNENRETFFERIERLWPTYDYRHQMILKAYNDAKDAFRGKYRDDAETRYFEHIRAVALIVIDYLGLEDHEVIVAALLHDIVEDCPEWTIERVAVEYNQRVALMVSYLSKPKIEDKVVRNAVYHNMLLKAERCVILIKLADRVHNMLTLWNCTLEKRHRKIAETRQHYLPMARVQIVLYHELLAIIEELEARSEE